MDAPNVILDAVKKAEDDDRLILRLYEAHGAQVRAKVTFGFKVGRAELVNLMEEEPRPVAVRDGAVGVEFRPFEVHTLRVERGKS
jgi:alpha-mannosidase